MSLTVKFRYRFEAAHRFTGSAAPSCQTPHGHTWYATAVFKMTSEALDQGAMAAEFGKTKKLWKEFITETADHSFMHNQTDELVPHLKKLTPGARLLAFPADPTTELISGLFAFKLRAMYKASGITKVEPVAVHIQERTTYSITFKFEKDGGTPNWLKSMESVTNAWWNSPDPKRRA
jgi:6-pyruvoyl-tetrahydropterin synthase